MSADPKALRAYYRTAPVGKTFRTSAAVVRAKTRKSIIEANHFAVFARSNGCCEFCGDTESITWAKFQVARTAKPATHHCHEVFITRALGRGLPPEDVFNLRNCARVCPTCHDRHHAKRLAVTERTPGAGCNGGLLVDWTAGPVELPAWALAQLGRV